MARAEKKTHVAAARRRTSTEPDLEVGAGDAVPSPDATAAVAPATAAPRFAPSEPAAVLAFAIEAARMLRDDKCEDVVLLDISKISQVTDYILIASGTSERQMRSVLTHVQKLGETKGFGAFRTNTDERSTWLLADFVDLVVHLFEPNIRAHYDLEALWSDGTPVAWERPDQVPRDRAGLRS